MDIYIHTLLSIYIYVCFLFSGASHLVSCSGICVCMCIFAYACLCVYYFVSISFGAFIDAAQIVLNTTVNRVIQFSRMMRNILTENESIYLTQYTIKYVMI